ncbi:MAG: hydrogenase maturation nickel metallochaperone HypA [Acidobacteriota bacterium]
MRVHEMGIAMSIYETCRTAVAPHGNGRMEVVRIAIGELSALEPELVKFAWEALTAQGPDAGCRLEIDWRPAHQLCPACREEKPRAAGAWLHVCPDCGQPLEITGGDELDVLQVSFVGYDAEGGPSS